MHRNGSRHRQHRHPLVSLQHATTRPQHPSVRLKGITCSKTYLIIYLRLRYDGHILSPDIRRTFLSCHRFLLHPFVHTTSPPNVLCIPYALYSCTLTRYVPRIFLTSIYRLHFVAVPALTYYISHFYSQTFLFLYERKQERNRKKQEAFKKGYRERRYLFLLLLFSNPFRRYFFSNRRPGISSIITSSFVLCGFIEI